MYKWVQSARDTKTKTSQISKKSGSWDFLKKQKNLLGYISKVFFAGTRTQNRRSTWTKTTF